MTITPGTLFQALIHLLPKPKTIPKGKIFMYIGTDDNNNQKNKNFEQVPQALAFTHWFLNEEGVRVYFRSYLQIQEFIEDCSDQGCFKRIEL